MTTPAVTMRGVYKRFGDVAVLNGLDLEVAPGEKLSIIGPSGSGKSTILRILMTLDSPERGSVELEGETLWPANGSNGALRRVRGKVGMVFQSYNLFPHMNVLRNVALAPVQVLGLSPLEAEVRARELLNKVGLSSKTDVFPAQLSGGQRQRVAIARALAMRPNIMLFDEVTSALDPELVGEVLAVLRDLAHQTDMTMILVTHEMRFAREISDRIAFIDGGVVVEDGPPAQILSEPREPRTRAFLQALLDA